MDKETLMLIYIEVDTSFTREELIGFQSFKDFFAEIDVQNGHEDEWEEKKEEYKPYYLEVYNDLKGIK